METNAVECKINLNCNKSSPGVHFINAESLCSNCNLKHHKVAINGVGVGGRWGVLFIHPPHKACLKVTPNRNQNRRTDFEIPVIRPVFHR